MFVSPTPANTPSLNAAGSNSPLEHVVIDVAAEDHAHQGIPALKLAPSVLTALTTKLQKQQLSTTPQYATRNVPGSGNEVKVASVHSHSFPDTPCRE